MSHPKTNKLLTACYLFYERLKGPKTLTLLPTKESDYLLVQAKSFFGYTVEIRVKRVLYECTYANRWFGNTYYMTFEVTGSVRDVAPVEIVSAFSRTFHFPRMLPSYVPLEFHLERAVNSYVDMVLQQGIRDCQVTLDPTTEK